MEDFTTAVNMNGVWYLRLPPAFARHIKLPPEDKYKEPVECKIRDEVNDKDPTKTYISAWRKGF